MDATSILGRRDFVKIGAAAACAGPFVTLADVYAKPRAAPGDRITMALIGCGSMGRGNLNGFLRQPDTQIVAVCDPDESRRNSTKSDVEKFYANQTRDGTFRFQSLPAGRYRIWVRYFASGQDLQGSVELNLEPDGQREVELDLKPGS